VAAGLDTSVDEWSLEPPQGGACFRIVEIAPETGDAPDTEHDTFQETHQTDTLDFVTVLRGEVTVIVDGSEVTLYPGDSVVQQPGVPHNWQNRSAEPTVLVGVLLSPR
jgi:quercetin dioxygenase-like cupin family protein